MNESSVGKLLRDGADVFGRDAEAWGLSPRRAVLIALFPVLATVAFVAAAPVPRLFMWMIDEDALLETVQFVLVLSATLVFAVLSARLLRGRQLVGLLYALVTVGLFFVAGEEISWGQRIFGLRTPEALEALVPLLALALPAGQRASRLGRLLIPPLFLIPAFFMPFGYRFTRLALQPEQYVEPGYRVFVITEFNEVTELCLYFGLLVFGWLNLRRRPAVERGK